MEGCKLMNSRGGPPIRGCMLMNSRGGPSILSSRDNFYGCSGTYLLDVLWPRLSRLIQPMYYSGNHGLSYEYLSFIFCSAIIFCT